MRKGNTVCTDKVDQANLLNAQFQSDFSIRSPLNLAKLCHSKHLNGTASLISLLPERINCKYPSMSDIEISTAGVAKIFSNLNVSKVAGLDYIVLKEISQAIAPVIKIIFQTSLDSGTVLSDLEKAQVYPLFKKVNKTDPANYRPISLTCILCKTIGSNLCKHLYLNNILYDLQHGFREKRSFETQLI